jgi:hypothetical protein
MHYTEQQPYIALDYYMKMELHLINGIGSGSSVFPKLIFLNYKMGFIGMFLYTGGVNVIKVCIMKIE